MYILYCYQYNKNNYIHTWRYVTYDNRDGYDEDNDYDTNHDDADDNMGIILSRNYM